MQLFDPPKKWEWSGRVILFEDYDYLKMKIEMMAV